ncbi:uncharacterized protein Triagg1_1717 [Trichoderma aggressivum f. europaeum]|uniref:Mitochondrial division protein 1 n=1 Tax=Trichoderma aggressivum f. europaeum TaxID=173218 RepID=A0AAE1IHY5_9HYPO|nr:hypothetical protein Triagg1_1717 [Trichoderma aggressivum f. europaeum]
MIATYQPLSISELRCLTPLLAGVDLKQLITKRFIFFLEVREDVVYFNHGSSKEFLLKRYNHDGKATPQRHAEIALHCLRTLVSSDYETNVSRSTYFSSSHWVKHLLRSKFVSDNDTKGIGLNIALMDFLNRGFTWWLSAMSKTSHPFSRANRHLLRLRDYLTSFTDKKAPPDDIIVNLLDAVRFHIFHDNVSVDYPMYSRNDDSTVRPKDSLLFYPFDGFKVQLLKEEFPQLLNVPATEYNVNDMVLNIRFPSEVNCFAYSPDGRFLASPLRGTSADVCIWDAYTGTCIRIVRTPALFRGHLSNIAFSASGELARTSRSAIDGYNLSTRTHIEGFPQKVAERRTNLEDLTFSPDGKQLVAMTSANIFIWDLSSSTKHLYPLPESQYPKAIKLLGDDKIAITSNKGLEIWGWKTEKRVLHTLHDDTWEIESLAFSPKRQLLAAAFKERKSDEETEDNYAIKIWEVNSGKLLHTSKDLQGGTWHLSFSFDGTRLAAAGYYDKYISIWNLEKRHFDHGAFELMQYDNDSRELFQSMEFSPKDLSLATLFHNRNTKKHGTRNGRRQWWSTIRVWDASAFEDGANKRPIRTDGHTRAIRWVKFSHNGEFFATADCGGKICVWDGETGNYQASFESKSRHFGDDISLLISPDDRSLATYSQGAELTIWDTATWSPRQELIGYKKTVSCAAFSLDGKRLASASRGEANDPIGAIKIWNLHGFSGTDEILKTKPTGGTEIADEWASTCMAFSPDGTQLACCADNLKIWKLSPDGSLNLLQQLDHGGRDIPHSISFSQDAEFIIGSGYYRLSFWKIESKHCERSINVEMWFQSLKWDPEDPQYIFTDLGPYYIGKAFDTRNPKDTCRVGDDVRMPPATSPESSSCTLQKDGRGIHWKGKSLVKFPDRYRPLVWDNSLYMASIHGRKVALGFESGHVTLLNFGG